MAIILSSDQQDVVDAILKDIDHKHVQTVGGLAGTGKTVVAAHLFERLAVDREVNVLAPTGKAVDVLRQNGLPAARTIHEAIYTLSSQSTSDHTIVAQDGTEKTVTWVDGLEFRRKGRLKAGVILVDEASMVGADTVRDLKRLGLPIVAVGDHGQLPPVDQKGGWLERPDYVLETIHRNAGPIAHFAAHLRKGGAPRSFECGDTDAVDFVDRAGASDLYTAVDQIICGMNTTRVKVNAAVRAERGLTGDVCVGDRLISLRNSRGAKLCNGTQVEVVSVAAGHLTFRLRGGGTNGGALLARSYHPDQFGLPKPIATDLGDYRHPFDYGYCVTGHKAQGSEWGTVLVLDESLRFKWSGGEDMVRRWRYTAATRAKNKLIWSMR